MKLTIMGKGRGSNILVMLAWIELLGNIGHSASFKVFADGDGNTRFGFLFEDNKQQTEFDKLKKELLKYYKKTGKDIESIEI